MPIKPKSMPPPQALEGVKEESKIGTRTTLDVLNAEQELLDAQIDQVKSQHDRDLAVLQIKAAIGPTDGGQSQAAGRALRSQTPLRGCQEPMGRDSARTMRAIRSRLPLHNIAVTEVMLTEPAARHPASCYRACPRLCCCCAFTASPPMRKQLTHQYGDAIGAVGDAALREGTEAQSPRHRQQLGSACQNGAARHCRAQRRQFLHRQQSRRTTDALILDPTCRPAAIAGPRAHSRRNGAGGLS